MHRHFAHVLRQPEQDLLLLAPDSDAGVIEGACTLPDNSEVWGLCFLVMARNLKGLIVFDCVCLRVCGGGV